jgi:FkbM family methyltransferase
MVKIFKKILFNLLGQDNYLNLLSLLFPLSYRFGLLKGDPNYDFHYYVSKLIKPGFTVIDIGANMGYYTQIFAKLVGRTGKVVAIEPVYPFYKVMKKIADKYPQCNAYNYALGSEEKKITMTIPKKDGYLRTGLASVKIDEDDISMLFSFESQMVKASDFFQKLEKINYIKCDIEGYETVVIPEIQNLIEKHKPMLQIETFGDQREIILKIMKDLGYQRYSLHQKKLVKDLTLEKHFGDFLFIYESEIA